MEYLSAIDFREREIHAGVYRSREARSLDVKPPEAGAGCQGFAESIAVKIKQPSL